ncbi:MAG: hypothetical protein KC493_09910 [Bacteriovoracaceae bacterium]|nr:hypothetical protein [Bacteriovoracaceae bacterium]
MTKVDPYIHLKELDPTLEKIRDVSRVVTDTELDFLRLYEQLLVYLIKKPGLDIELKGKVFDVLQGINSKQIKVLSDMSNTKVKVVRKKNS